MVKRFYFVCFLSGFPLPAVYAQVLEHGASEQPLLLPMVTAAAETPAYLDKVSAAAVYSADGSTGAMFGSASGVEISTSGSRQAAQLRIRGFGTDYTEAKIDGMPAPLFFHFGSYAAGGLNSLEMDTVRQAEAVKGRHSAAQSNQALAGTADFRTYRPGDFVSSGRPYYAALQSGYSSSNDGWGLSLTGAAAKDSMAGLVMYSYRRYGSLENFASEAENAALDSHAFRQNNLLAKGEWTGDGARLVLTGERFALHDAAKKPDGTRYPARTERRRVSLQGEFDGALGLDSLQTHLYWQDFRSRDDAYTNRQRQYGIGADGVKFLYSGAVEQRLSFGAGLERRHLDWLHEKPGAPAVRYIPKTARDTLSLYAEDAFRLPGGFTLVPGIRAEYQRVHTEIDSAYLANPALKKERYLPQRSSLTVSPVLRAELETGAHSRVYAAYSRGEKRAEDRNAASFWHKPVRGRAGYYLMPNPDLKDETSHNAEAGFSYRNDGDMLKLSGFYSHFRNMIETRYEPGSRSVRRPYNIGRAEVYGAELQSQFVLGGGVQLNAGLSWMHGRAGKARDRGTALAQITPLQGSLGVSYAQKTWGAGASWRFSGKGSKTDAGSFRTPGYGIADVSLWWQPRPYLRAAVSVNNLFDKKYWLSTQANGLAVADGRGRPLDMDVYSEPGRNVWASLRLNFE